MLLAGPDRGHGRRRHHRRRLGGRPARADRQEPVLRRLPRPARPGAPLRPARAVGALDHAGDRDAALRHPLLRRRAPDGQRTRDVGGEADQVAWLRPADARRAGARPGEICRCSADPPHARPSWPPTTPWRPSWPRGGTIVTVLPEVAGVDGECGASPADSCPMSGRRDPAVTTAPDGIAGTATTRACLLAPEPVADDPGRHEHLGARASRARDASSSSTRAPTTRRTWPGRRRAAGRRVALDPAHPRAPRPRRGRRGVRRARRRARAGPRPRAPARRRGPRRRRRRRRPAGWSCASSRTPGHSSDSLCFWLPADGRAHRRHGARPRHHGDRAPDGDLADYLRSLDRLRALADDAGRPTLLPGHGPVLADPVGALDDYIAHRRERLDQVAGALAAGRPYAARGRGDVYADVDRALWPAAELSVRAQLDYLGPRLPPGVDAASPVGGAETPAVSGRCAGARRRAGRPRAPRGAASRAAAKSASALFTVSREAPTSWASSSWVRSWWTRSPSRSARRTARPGRAAPWPPGRGRRRRPGRPCTSLVRRSRWASARSRCTATSGRPVSQGRRSSWPSPARRTSVSAVAVAVRGRGSNSDSSPNISPGPRTPSRFSRPSGAVRVSLILPSSDHVEPVARLALVEQRLPLGAAGPRRCSRAAPRRSRRRARRTAGPCPAPRRCSRCLLLSGRLHARHCDRTPHCAGPRQEGPCPRRLPSVPRNVSPGWGVPARPGAPGPPDGPRSWRRPTPTPTASSTSAPRSSCWSRRSSPPSPRTNGSTWSPRRSSPATRRAALRRGRPRRAGGDHPLDRLLPRQDRQLIGWRRRCATASAARSPAGWRTWSRCPASAARPPTWCSATPSACPAHRRHPLPAAGRAASAGPRRPTRSRSSTRSAELFPKRDWTSARHRVIWHGRRICHARKPACGVCPLAALCPSYGERPHRPRPGARKLVTPGPVLVSVRRTSRRDALAVSEVA